LLEGNAFLLNKVKLKGPTYPTGGKKTGRGVRGGKKGHARPCHRGVLVSNCNGMQS